MKSQVFRRFSIALVVAGALFGSDALAQDVEITDKARTHFTAGVNLLNDPDGARYEEAYVQFKAAYDESPSWKILGNLGICAMKLERDGEAIGAFKGYLDGGGDSIDPDERAQMRRDLSTLKAGVVYVTLQSDPPGAVVVDTRMPSRGSHVVNRYDLKEPMKIGIRPGAHRMVASLPGRVDAEWELTATAGQTVEHTFRLEEPKRDEPAPVAPTSAATPGKPAPAAPSPEMERPVPTPVFIGLAATGVFAVGAGVTGFLALGKKSDYDDANDGTDPRGAEDLKSSGQTLNLVTDVLIGGAVVAGAVTAVLYLNRPEVPVQRDASWGVMPSVGRNGGGLAVSGHF